MSVEFANGGASVTESSEGVSSLVVFDAFGNPFVEAFARGRIELPGLDDRVGRHTHLADGPLPIFFPGASDRLWLRTGN